MFNDFNKSLKLEIKKLQLEIQSSFNFFLPSGRAGGGRGRGGGGSMAV